MPSKPDQNMLTAQNRSIGSNYRVKFLYAFYRRAGIPRHTDAPERISKEVPD